jgi:hypothetical protein
MARVTRYSMPNGPAVSGNGHLLAGFQHYLAGLADVSNRVAVKVDPLAASPTNAEIATAFNALLTALTDARLMESE